MKFKPFTIVLILAASGLGYYLWSKRRKTAADLGAAAGTAAGTAAVNAAAAAAGQIVNQGGAGSGTPAPGTAAGKYIFTENEKLTLLNFGKTGTNVKALQLYLNERGQNLTIDGNFGTLTETALNTEKGQKTITLQDLDITAVDISAGKVYGKQFGYMPEGVYNGITFS